MTGLALRAATSQDLPATRVPIDLVQVMPARARFDALVVRFDNMQPGSTLSAGHNNGDRSWTVTTDELAGLFYYPGRSELDDHSLYVRIVGIIEGEEGVVVDQFDFDITADGRTPQVPMHDGRTSQGAVANFGVAKAWSEGKTWSKQAANSEPATQDSGEPELRARVSDLSQRLEEAESRIAELSRTAAAVLKRLAVADGYEPSDELATYIALRNNTGGGPVPA